MNILSSLPSVSQRKKKRVGRGAGTGKGAKSGRGTTRHQKAREKIPLHFEGGQGRFVKKFPLLRGKSRNKSVTVPVIVVTLAQLNTFKEGDNVDIESLIAHNIITEKEAQKGVKVLATGVLEKKLIIKLPVSQAAKIHIEKLGGEVGSI